MTCSLLAGLLFIVTSASSLSLPPLQLLNSEPQEGLQNSSGSGFLSPSNGAIIPPNSSSLDAPFTECSAAKFGSPVNPPSCREAIEKIKWNDTQLTFRDREDDELFDVGLPYRTLSSERSYIRASWKDELRRYWYAYMGSMVADGKCSVQLFLNTPAVVAHASFTEIRHAAQAAYDACATHPATGGSASRIGRYLYICKSKNRIRREVLYLIDEY